MANLLLQSERLFLHPIHNTDAEFVYRLVNSDGFKQYIGNRNINSIAEAKVYIDNRYIDDEKFVFVIKEKKTNVPIGTCGIYKRLGLDEHDLGYALLPQFYRKGYAYEASLRLLQYAKQDLNKQQLCAITALYNQASIQLLNKLQFQQKGIITLPNIEEELYLFTYQF